jgi:hypothetical protein
MMNNSDEPTIVELELGLTGFLVCRVGGREFDTQDRSRFD